MEYKVGDRVRIASSAEEAYDHIGCKGVIISIGPQIVTGQILPGLRKTEIRRSRGIRVLLDGQKTPIEVPDKELEFER